MRGYKDVDTVVAEIKMIRTVHSGSFLVLEGSDDLRFWHPRKHGECEIIDGECKSNVVGTAVRLDAKNVSGVLGIVDEDYDCLDGQILPSNNLISVVPHDLECFLCRSRALNTVLAEYGDREKISRFEHAHSVDVRTGLLLRTSIFGRLRWAAVRFALEIDFSAIRIPRFVDQATWDVNEEEVINVVASGSEEELRHYMTRLPEIDPWRVSRGHDMLQILRIGLRSVLGNVKNSVGVKEIARVLRASMGVSDFRQTSLWEDIDKWERNNQPYRAIEV